jgi:hypothetical protein
LYSRGGRRRILVPRLQEFLARSVRIEKIELPVQIQAETRGVTSLAPRSSAV